MCAYKITPSQGPNFNVPLAYDGTDYVALRTDASGVLAPDPDLLAPHQRTPVNASLRVSVQAGNHAWTSRATYTVTSGKHAVIQMFFANLDPPTTTGVVAGRLRVNSKELAYLIVNSASTIDNQWCNIPMAVDAIAGEVVDIYTINTSTTTVWYTISVQILQFDL